uniref:Uncharacterized protein n=1 Tax=Lygus hesperus TaxID=30085 RepID=A0A146LWG4_LYGHE
MYIITLTVKVVLFHVSRQIKKHYCYTTMTCMTLEMVHALLVLQQFQLDEIHTLHLRRRLQNHNVFFNATHMKTTTTSSTQWQVTITPLQLCLILLCIIVSSGDCHNNVVHSVW